jgi:hypothetical protein
MDMRSLIEEVRRLRRELDELKRNAELHPARQGRDAAPDFFLVKVEKDGGADGTKTTAASWTYTVRAYVNGATLGTAVPLARPRPNGRRLYPTGSDGAGIAFHDADGNLKLWDAGEYRRTAGCN